MEAKRREFLHREPQMNAFDVTQATCRGQKLEKYMTVKKEQDDYHRGLTAGSWPLDDNPPEASCCDGESPEFRLGFLEGNDDRQHAENRNRERYWRCLGILVDGLIGHRPGDYGDCSINHPILTLIDDDACAEDLLRALSDMPKDTIEALANQLVVPFESMGVPF